MELNTEVKEYFDNFNNYGAYYQGPWKLVRKRFVSAIRKKCAGGRKINILDLGCGRSTSLPELLEDPNVLTYTCVDFSPDSLASLRNLRHPKLKIYESDIISFVQKCDKRFDIVMLLGVIMYFPRPEALKLFSIIGKILNPDSLILLLEPSKGAEGKIDRYSKAMTRDFLADLVMAGRGLKINWAKAYGVLWLRRCFYFLFKGFKKLNSPKQIITMIEDCGWRIENFLENIFSFFGYGSDYFIVIESNRE